MSSTIDITGSRETHASFEEQQDDALESIDGDDAAVTVTQISVDFFGIGMKVSVRHQHHVTGGAT